MSAHGTALALLASALLAWACGGEQPPRSAPGAPAVSRPGGGERGPSEGGAFHVRLDMLPVERGRVLRPHGPLARNPFRFGLSSQHGVAASHPRWEEPVGWPDPPPLGLLTWSDPAAAAWSNPTPLMLIGVIEAPASAGRIAVLTDGQAVYHGRVGDVLGAYARIVSIIPPSIVLESLVGSRYTLDMAP